MEAATQATEQQRRTEGNIGTVEEVQGVPTELNERPGLSVPSS